MSAESIIAFRADLRDFIRRELPLEIAGRVAGGMELDKSDYVRWQQILHRHGWFAGAWPVEHGGQGWDLRRQLAFLQETALNDAPMIIPYGVSMVGPVIYTFGSEAQKRQHLPGVLSSEVWWCQGYSEPGAGSDLAALRTTAVRDGDEYVVNGSKLWTTEAHWADMMHCLVRTSNTGKRQEGISFLLIDMKTPGITVRPILTIDGQHHTNEVFLDDVRVPAGNLVGSEGDGWRIAKFLLGNERVAIADTGAKLRLLARLSAMNAMVQADPTVLPMVKAQHAARLVDLTVRLDTLCALEEHCVEAWAAGSPLGSTASMLKVRGTEVLQAMSEFAVALQGAYAGVHDPADLHLPGDARINAARQASMMAHQYLYGRCWSIFGGTNEVQRNIIAAGILP
ncbi:MAG: acyl-CoA dehydrogenase family protein [Alphaproteobacteria bacterium]|nr:acyl-CoA dehydrogenase family protein [Alphaproteobacteria bacterium]